MIIIQHSNRYSYKKVKYLWDIIDELLEKYNADTRLFSVVSRDKLAFHTMYSYGLRPSEALYLRSNDINVDNNDKNYGCITVSTPVNQGSKPNKLISTYKTRIVYPLFYNIANDLKAYFKILEFNQTTTDNYVFRKSNEEFLSVASLNKRLKTYNSKSNYTEIIKTLHSFRQLYITDLFADGSISLNFISNQIGQSITNNLIYSPLTQNPWR